MLVLLTAFAASDLGSANSLQGPQRVEFLLNNLEKAGDYKVRMAAATELGKIADGTLGDWMLRAFRREDNKAVRLATLYAVAQIPDHRILPPLMELWLQELLSEGEQRAVETMLWNFRSAFALTDWELATTTVPDASERALAAWLLGIVGDSTAIPYLKAASRDPAPLVRRRALQAVGNLGSQKGKDICASSTRTDRDPTVRELAESCLSRLALLQEGKLPLNKTHRTDLRNDLTGLSPNSVTLESFRAYRRKNVNPRAVEVAAATLQENFAEEREDKSVKLVDHERMLRTIHFDAVLYTAHPFSKVDLNRLREVVRDEAGHINQCYLAALRENRKLGGDITVDFTVLKSGTVSTTSIEEATLPSAKACECIVQKVHKIRFPSLPISMVKMRYTFSFTPPKDEKYEFTTPPHPVSSRK